MQRLKLLSYNIQAGIYTRQYSEYVTNSWKHLLPERERLHNLSRIASMLRDYDLVGLQEVDAGSLRSGFIDQVAYLAHEAGFPFWFRQVNRDLGKIAQHSNGVLSRIQPSRITEHRLPGLPGRGAVIAEMDTSDGGALAICILHLALGWRARRRQLKYIARQVSRHPYLVMMGDFNCDSRNRFLHKLVGEMGLKGLDRELKTFPSWRPKRNLDHILISKSLRILSTEVIDYPMSDHLPLSMTVALPDGVFFTP